MILYVYPRILIHERCPPHRRDGEFEEYVRQSLDAYPVMMENISPETQKTWMENMRKAQAEPGPIHYYGVFRGGKMVGGARYHDFDMNIHGAIVKAGGVANVFVDLLHKKEHVAKELMEHFHTHYRAEGRTYGFPLSLPPRLLP